MAARDATSINNDNHQRIHQRRHSTICNQVFFHTKTQRVAVTAKPPTSLQRNQSIITDVISVTVIRRHQGHHYSQFLFR